jgi:hypothetical protein
MADTSVRRSSWSERLKPPTRRRQRGLLVEYALVALLIAFTAVHLLFVFSTS